MSGTHRIAVIERVCELLKSVQIFNVVLRFVCDVRDATIQLLPFLQEIQSCLISVVSKLVQNVYSLSVAESLNMMPIPNPFLPEIELYVVCK